MNGHAYELHTACTVGTYSRPTSLVQNKILSGMKMYFTQKLVVPDLYSCQKCTLFMHHPYQCNDNVLTAACENTKTYIYIKLKQGSLSVKLLDIHPHGYRMLELF